MRRRCRWFTTILAIIMVFPTLVGLGSAKDVMAESANQTVTLHKRAFETLPDEAIPNTGDIIDFAGEPLAGAVFTAYDVSTIYWTAYDAATGTDAARTEAAEEAVMVADTENTESFVFPATDIDGIATLAGGLPKKSMVAEKARNAIYLFKETTSPAGVVQGQSIPFILGLPVYDEGTDTEKEVVHIYPKNEIKELDFGFTKYGVDEVGTATVLQGAKFVLKEAGGSYYNEGTFDEGAIADAKVFVSGVDGKVSTGGLVLNPGTYEFYEIDSEVSVAGNQDEENAEKYHYQNNPVVTVHVSENMEVTYDYLDITGEATYETTGVAEGAKAYNYLVPSPTKTVGDSDVDVDQEITFTITQMIPQDISTYDSFVLVDDFGANFNLISTGTEIANAAGYDAVVTINDTNFTVEFPIASLVGHEGEDITFDVVMSLKSGVELGEDIFNNIELENPYYNKKDKVPVQTFGKSFLKTDMDTGKELTGAKFYVKKGNLYLGSQAGKQAWAEPTGGVAGEYTFADGFTVTVLESGADGTFSVAGLAQKEGTMEINYALEEFVAPDGYALLKDEVSFVADNGSLDLTLTVANKHKGSLPSTGGSGIVAFVLIGIVAVGGAVLYFTKGRRQIEG